MVQIIGLVDTMGRKLNPNPAYVYNKPNRARIYYKGEFRSLPGKYQSEESLAAFARMAAIIAATGELPPKETAPVLTIAAIGEKFNAFAKKEYKSREPVNLSYAVRAMVDLFADLPAAEFKPSHLKAIRDSLIKRGQCRNTINIRTKQIVRIFAWAVENEYLPESVWNALKAVKPIARDRGESFDYEPKTPVSEHDYNRVLEVIKPEYALALKVQWWTGMRSGELLAMCPQNVDMSGRHWFYTPKSHKTMSVTGQKIIGIPEPAANLLRENMPKDWSCRWFNYRPDTLYHAVLKACKRADIAPWTPHQLRHGLATRCKSALGVHGEEAARLLLSHASPRVTARYAKATIDNLLPILDELSK